jgi:hypothetical protein
MLNMADTDDLERGAYVIGRPVPIPKKILREPVRWEDLEIGQEFDGLEYRVGPDEAQAYADITEDQNRWYAEASLLGGPFAPPTMCDNDVLNCIGTRYLRSGRRGRCFFGS